MARKSSGRPNSTDTEPSNVSSTEAEEEYEVESIRGWRYNAREGTKQFLIKWIGWSEDDNTWEDEENLHCPDALEEFTNNLSPAEYRCFKTKHKDKLSGFQRNANFIKIVAADGPHESDEEEEPSKTGRRDTYLLVMFEDSDELEEITTQEVFKHKPMEVFEFLEERLIDNRALEDRTGKRKL